MRNMLGRGLGLSSRSRRWPPVSAPARRRRITATGGCRWSAAWSAAPVSPRSTTTASNRTSSRRLRRLSSRSYVAPAATVPYAAPAVPSATTIEDQLNVLDQLAAKGYITPAQYQARRQALLDQL